MWTLTASTAYPDLRGPSSSVSGKLFNVFRQQFGAASRSSGGDVTEAGHCQLSAQGWQRRLLLDYRSGLFSSIPNTGGILGDIMELGRSSPPHLTDDS